jgi:hypothetical protein
MEVKKDFVVPSLSQAVILAREEASALGIASRRAGVESEAAEYPGQSSDSACGVSVALEK